MTCDYYKGGKRCTRPAVTFHGISTIVTAYCEEHRCCGECGFRITDCRCPGGMWTERGDYVDWVRSRRRSSLPRPSTWRRITFVLAQWRRVFNICFRKR